MNYPFIFFRLIQFLKREGINLIFPLHSGLELSYDQVNKDDADNAIVLISDFIEKDQKAENGWSEKLQNKNRQESLPAIFLSIDGELKFGRVVKMGIHNQPRPVYSFFSKKTSEEGTGPKPQLKQNTKKSDEAFLHELEKILNEHLSDSSFTVETLAREMTNSRSKLYRKIKSISGHSIAMYIRVFRLQRARHLLEETDWSISEIAYEVGFNDPSYFSRTFMQEFGHSPRIWRKASRSAKIKQSIG